MKRHRKIIIYDSKCFYCNKFKLVIERLDRKNNFKFISYYSRASKKILNSQFGERKFALYLFYKDKVHAGEFAVKKIMGVLNLKKISILYKLYPVTVDIVSHLTRRKIKVEKSARESKLKKETVRLLKKYC